MKPENRFRTPENKDDFHFFQPLNNFRLSLPVTAIFSRDAQTDTKVRETY